MAKQNCLRRCMALLRKHFSPPFRTFSSQASCPRFESPHSTQVLTSCCFRPECLHARMKESDRIDYKLDTPANRRRVLMRPAIKKVPWYSLQRNRNLVIAGVILGLLPFSKMFFDMFRGLKQGMRLDKERDKFIKELELEELEEENAAQQKI